MRYLLVVVYLVSAWSLAAVPTKCNEEGAWLQVLGSGGPELDDGRVSTSYVVWLDGKAKLLIEAGAGSHRNFERIGANFNELDAIIFTHLHVDHSNDLPAFVKSSFFTGRHNDLVIAGPDGNNFLPSIDQFLQRLFGSQGAWPYLSNHVDGSSRSYQLVPKVVSTTSSKVKKVISEADYTITAIGVDHGPLPAIAWRIHFPKLQRSVVFSGDMGGFNNNLQMLAKNTDLLVAHHAVPESARGVARRLHMSPSRIADIAVSADVKKVLLSHRMKRTNDSELETKEVMKTVYNGEISVADDLQCYKL